MKFAMVIAAGVALATSAPAMSQEPAEASYEDSMKCAALYIYAAEVIGAGDAASKSVLLERATRWTAMAMARDEEDGARADRELEDVVQSLIGKIESLGDDDEAQNRFALEQFARCDVLEEANAEEFASFEYDEDEG